MTTNQLQEIKLKNPIVKIIMKYMSESEDVLNITINLNKNTMYDLYFKIKSETNKVNIASIIVNNEYSWTYYDYDTNLTFYDDDDDNLIFEKKKLFQKMQKISTILGEDYNKDYIEVTIILGSYIPYIKKIIFAFLFRVENYLKSIKTEQTFDKNYIKNLKIDLENDILQLNKDYILLNDYEVMKLYIKNVITSYIIDEDTEIYILNILNNLNTN